MQVGELRRLTVAHLRVMGNIVFPAHDNWPILQLPHVALGSRNGLVDCNTYSARVPLALLPTESS